MKYAYYPGCSAHSTAQDMHKSSMAVASYFNIELIEIKGWSCCGASAAHQTDRVLAAALPIANLIQAKETGFDMVMNCAACYNRTKTANFEVLSSPEMQKLVAEAVGKEYNGSVKIRHLVEVLLEDVGIEKIRSGLKKTLDGLKVACYYGCFLVRPPEVTGFDNPENPISLDRLVTAMGGESLDWPYKTECCGGSLNLTRNDVLIKLSGSIIDMAYLSGADCIVVACPMCQASLDLRQKDIAKERKQKYELPVIYITQLLGLCLDIPQRELGLNRLIVKPSVVLKNMTPVKSH
jgi:heterodisulfide reductase subunit B